jgi:dolichol-phosphate mannosyltransferase
MKVSVILPTYNEAGNIVKLIHEIIENIPVSWEYEIIVVDDNSPDGTFQKVLQTFQDNVAVVPIIRKKDRGVAKSIRAGVEKATGDQVLVMDTDFTHDPIEIPRLLHVGVIYDIVCGSRFCSGGNMQDRAHYLASLTYNFFLRVILRTQIQDNLGGYFTIKRKKLLKLPLDRIFYGYGEYFFRLIHFAQRRGHTIVELPALYLDRSAGESKSNLPKMFFTYSIAAIKLKLLS